MEDVILLCNQPLEYKWMESSLSKEGFNVIMSPDLSSLSNQDMSFTKPPKMVVNIVSSGLDLHNELILFKKLIEKKFKKKLLLACFNDNDAVINNEISCKYDLVKDADESLAHNEFIEKLLHINASISENSKSNKKHNSAEIRMLERVFVKLTSINQLLSDFGKKYVEDLGGPLKETIETLDSYLMSYENTSTRNGKNFFDYRDHIREYFSSLGFFNYTLKLQPNKINMLLDSKYGIVILDDIMMSCVAGSMSNKNIIIFEKITSEGLEIEFRFFCFEINIVKTKLKFATQLLRLHGGDIKIHYDISGSSILLTLPSYRVQNS